LGVPEGVDGTSQPCRGSGAQVFDTWKRTTAQERASYIFRAAQIIESGNSNWRVGQLEVGKTWPEATRTSGNIDFLEFYGGENAALGRAAKN